MIECTKLSKPSFRTLYQRKREKKVTIIQILFSPSSDDKTYCLRAHVCSGRMRNRIKFFGDENELWSNIRGIWALCRCLMAGVWLKRSRLFDLPGLPSYPGAHRLKLLSCTRGWMDGWTRFGCNECHKYL